MAPPPLRRVLETVLYYDDEAPMHRFYSETLGMREIGAEPGRFLFFRAGESVFLLFERERARSQSHLPPHGADGCVHTCFEVPQESYADWKRHLEAAGVELSEEVDWPGGGRSFYFADPAGNLLEIADRDFWPA